MSYETIEFTVLDGVAVLALNRPAVLNALSPAMVGEMRIALAALPDSGARALLLTGRGKGFCAGADLAGDVFSSNAGGFGESVAQALDTVFNPLIEALYGLDLPVVSAINGVAAGGGIGLALVADICIAAHSASFVQVFGPRLGIVPDAGSSWLTARLLGRARALGLAMLGDRLSAADAAAWGLIWRAVPDDALEAEAMKVARTLADGPTRAFPSIRRLTDAAATNTLPEQLVLERDQQRILADTADTIEGVAAFREKRRPNFQGR